VHPTVVINVVGLAGRHLGDSMPELSAFAARGRLRRLRPVLPAVTCSVQASMLTGTLPRDHGIVGNGWYDRDLAEVQFWKQSNRLVRGEKVWEVARSRDAGASCANLFWWFNMYSTVDTSVTPRPIYKADGRKIPDCYTEPPELRDELQSALGRFPLFRFWGPAASIDSSRWIAEASRIVYERCRPGLMLVYLPHLDYGLQKLGPGHPEMDAELRAIDAVAGGLIADLEQRGARVIVLSEYGIEPVQDAVAVNRVLRDAGLLRVRAEQGLELLDPGASDAFAVADHQVAHVYVRDPGHAARVAGICRGIDGVEQVLDREGQATHGLDHERAGELVLVAEPQRWFTYDYWLDDRRAPDFARTVDIHRKPGYDPRELFLDPARPLVKAQVGWRLLRKALGFRMLMDVIPLDTRLVRGSHGRVEQAPEDRPVLITSQDDGPDDEELPCTAVRDVILGHLFG
jgi:predicted AlkP superfamily pyrophosphatase or phosphodiesterase